MQNFGYNPFTETDTKWLELDWMITLRNRSLKKVHKIIMLFNIEKILSANDFLVQGTYSLLQRWMSSKWKGHTNVQTPSFPASKFQVQTFKIVNYRSISIFNCNPLFVETFFSLILDHLSKSNQRPNDRTNSLLTDGLRIYIRKSFEGSEKWFRTERGLQLKIEIDLYHHLFQKWILITGSQVIEFKVIIKVLQ